MLNRFEIIGHTGDKAEITHLKSGKRVANLAVATNKHWKDKDGNAQKHTDWHRLTVYQEYLIELLEKYSSKGRFVRVVGEMISDSYDDKYGNKNYVTRLVVTEFQFLDKKPE